jgi:hypothetical protein
VKPKIVAPLSVSTIRKYSDKKKLETAFKYHDVPIERRIELLTKAMGNPAISYTCGFPSAKIRYQIIVSSFINGNWRDNYEAIKNLSQSFRGKGK